MAIIDDLINQACEIRDAQEDQENTALRVGTMLVDIIQYLASFVGSDALEEILQGYASLDRGLVNWRQSRIVFLASMGSALDNIDGGNWQYTEHNGDVVFNPAANALRVVGEQGNLFVTSGVAYVNLHTMHSYMWDATAHRMVEITDSSKPTVIDYLNAPPFAEIVVGETYYYVSGNTKKIAIKTSSSGTYTFDPDPTKEYIFKDTRQSMIWDATAKVWVPIGNNTEIVDDLTTGGRDKALSAEQGKRLKRLIDQSGVSVEVVDNRLCIMATGGASKTPAPTINAEIQTDGRALVTISAADSGTAITYSINGGETQNYSQPFYINTVGTSTITAKAQADGELPSNTVTATVTTESAGTVTIAKGTDDDSVKQVTFTATASDPTATVTITIGQQTQSGTGSATLSVTKTDELQNVTVMATASVTGKIAATATQQFTVSKLPNTKLQGTSVNPTTGQPELVTDIYIGSKHYTNEASTTDDGMVIDNKTVDGVNVWTLDFEVDNGDGTKTYHKEITTLMRGTNGQAANKSGVMKSANIFGNIDNYENIAQTSKITAITKIPDCVTSFGANSLRWCSKLASIAILGSKVVSFGVGSTWQCYAEFSVDNDNFITGNMPTGLLSFRSNAKSSLNFHNQSKVKWIKMPNASGTGSSDVNCGGCTKLCYLEFGDPANESLVAGFSELRYAFIEGTSKPDVIAIHERNPSATKVTDTGSSNSFSNGLLFGLINDPTQDAEKPNVRFYVPDDAVDYYKEHEFWQYVSKRILPMSEKPTLEQVLANHIND